jgi:cobalt/nickel transport system permease protein
MYRYIFLLAEESLRMTRARDSRSAVLERQPSPIFQAKTTGSMIGSLLLRSFERSERVHQAMVARGYQGVIQQFVSPPVPAGDMLISGIALCAGAVLLLLSLLVA